MSLVMVIKTPADRPSLMIHVHRVDMKIPVDARDEYSEALSHDNVSCFRANVEILSSLERGSPVRVSSLQPLFRVSSIIPIFKIVRELGREKQVRVSLVMRLPKSSHTPLIFCKTNVKSSKPNYSNGRELMRTWP